MSATSLVIGRLSAFLVRIEELQAMYTVNGVIPADQVDVGRERYRSLKRDLEGESKGRPANPVEESVYYPAVREAYVHLSASVNAPSERWYSCLADAHLDINHALLGLQGPTS